MKRALTGIRTSGDIHIGNYLGAIKPALKLQNDYQCLYFLADLHSLTSQKDALLLQKSIYDQVALWIALGLDYKKHLLYRQSDLPNVELSWYLSCVTGVGFLEKAHAYKDSRAKNKDVNVGVFYYPILMAADILLYSPDVVPVGKDQKQHVEMARDIAGSFNATYGAGEVILKQPEVMIAEEVMLIPGLDGQKMSKSYNNTIELMLPEKQLRKKIMSLTTDSTPLEDPKVLSGSVLGNLFKLFASQAQFNDLEKRLVAGGLGWGNAKEELFQAINQEISTARTKYEAIRADQKFLEDVLLEGKNKAWEIADPILRKVREAIGISKK